MKMAFFVLAITILFNPSFGFAQTATSTTTTTETAPPRAAVPDFLQKAMTRVPTSYSLTHITIDYRGKFINVEVMVYDQHGVYISNTSVRIIGEGFNSVVTPDLLGKISQLAMLNVGK